MRISDWSSDVCSSDLQPRQQRADLFRGQPVAPLRQDRLAVAFVAPVERQRQDAALAPLVAVDFGDGLAVGKAANLVLGVVRQVDRRQRLLRTAQGRAQPLHRLADRADDLIPPRPRSEERGVGKEWVSPCKYWWARDH